jgi:hypothetical protein
MRALLILLCCTQILHAQHSLRNDYSIHDPCPDPKKNHIASRTIYTDQVGDQAKIIHVDTVFEKYDRNGNLIALNYFEAGTGADDPYWIKHEFSYDEKQRLVREETQFYDEGWHITYAYDENGDSVLVHHTRSRTSDEITFGTIYYSNIGDTIEYDRDQNGDTVRFIHATKDKFTTVWWERDEEQKKVMVDSIVTTRQRNKMETTAWFIDRSGQLATLEEVFYLNKKGRVTDKLIYLDKHILRDSVHYEYDKKGQCTLTTSTVFLLNEYSSDTAVTHWETKNLYDKEGRLVQSHESVLSKPQLRYVTSYIYNERGLLTEIHRVDLSYGHIVKEERQWWVYTYY